MAEEGPKTERPAALNYNEPSSVSSLKKSYRGKLDLPDAARLAGDLIKESDRSAVILGTALLDDLLANAMTLKMHPDILVSDLDWIFRQSGPLGSFSARLEVASLFEIIETDTFRQLTLLREMRNACAHSKHPIDFKNTLLANVAANFFKHGSTPEVMVRSDMKAAFAVEIAFLATVLGFGSREVALKMRAEAIAAHVARITASLNKPPS